MVKRWQDSDDEEDDFNPNLNHIDPDVAQKLKELEKIKATIKASVEEAETKHRVSRNIVKDLKKEVLVLFLLLYGFSDSRSGSKVSTGRDGQMQSGAKAAATSSGRS